MTLPTTDSSKEHLCVQLKRIRDEAQTTVDEITKLLSDLSGGECVDATAREEVESFQDCVRDKHDLIRQCNLYAMEFLANASRDVLHRADELGTTWSETTQQSFSKQLQQAKTDAEQLARQLVKAGLDDFVTRTKKQCEEWKKHPERLSPWLARTIRQESESLDREWDEAITRMCADMLVATRQRASDMADEIETGAHLANVEAAQQRRISSILSVRRIIEEMNGAAKFFEAKGQLTPDLQKQIRAGKERAARHRANEKLTEAKTAHDGGQKRKSENLGKQAVAILAQDWEFAFPSEDAPQIS